jgi:hypothetical protein
MLARFASGGDVSEGMKYATGEGGIGAAQYYANIRKFVNEKGSELDASQMRAEMDKYGVSDRDVRDALAGTQYSAGAVHALLNKDIGAENAPGRGVGGLQGMSANIKAYVDSLAAQAKSGDLSQKQVTDILAAQLGTYDPKAGVGGFNELDLQRATGKTSAELLKDMFPSRFTPPPIPSVPEPIAMPPITERPVEPIKVPPIDMAFRGSEQRTWDPVSRSFTYTPAASLQPATGSGLDFVPPVVTSRPRGLLNVRSNDIDPSTGKPLYQEGYDASTSTYTPAVSASTMNAEARRVLLSALSAGLAGKNIGTVDYYRLLNQARAGAFGNPRDPGFVQRISIEADKLKPITTYTSSPTTPGASSTSGPPGLAVSGVGGTPPPGTTLPSDIEPPKLPGTLFSQGGPVLKKSDGGDVSRGTLPPVRLAEGSPNPEDVSRETSKAPEVTGMNRVVDFIAQKLNPEWFPTSGRTLLETAQGVKTPITEKNFKPEELDAIRQLIALKGSDKGSITYGDYVALAQKLSKDGPMPMSFTPSLFSMGDPLGNIQTTLGRFSYRTDPKGNVQIIDKYDFNPPMQQDMREARTGDYGAFGPYGMIREYAGEKIPPGTGRDVLINLGRIKQKARPVAKFAKGSPNPDEVPVVDTEGQLVDEREEIRSESQRMLNRIASQSKLPPGLQRTIQGARARQGESMIPAAVPARDVMAGMFGAQAMNPGSEAYRTGQALANSPPVEVLKAPAKIASAAGDAATALSALGGAGVIKSKGGNWFKDLDSVEYQLNALLKNAGARNLPADQVLAEMNATYTPEAMARLSPESLAQVERAYAELKPAAAINKWVKSKLTKYVKNEMGTPEDPVRALAERGVLHIPTYDLDIMGLTSKRERAGMPMAPQGQSEAARFWEQMSDKVIDFTTPSRIKKQAKQGAWEHQRNENIQLLRENPWIKDVSADTKIYRPSISEDLVDSAGFGHLVDELENAMSPQSNLPDALRVQPKDLEKMTVPQAVERVAKINDWRAKEALKAEREGMLRNLQATPRLADNSLQLSFVDKPGGSWVDIPETTDPKGLALCTSIGRAGGWCTQGDYLAESYGSGEHRLTALVDAEGRPHAQAKITENDWPVSGEGFTRLDPQTKAQYGQYVREWRQRNPEIEELTDDDVIQALKEAGVKGPAPDITELKPPGNSFDSERAIEYAKRDPDYRAKVTDSVVRFLNSGEWGDVSDLHLYGIVDLKRDKGKVIPSARAAFDKAIKAQPTAPRFMTLDQFTKFLGYKNGGEVKLKHGGPVDKTTAFIKAHA